MRKFLIIPALAVAMLALGVSQALAQNAVVVMRSGERLNAQVIDMGADFTFRVNGQERHVPIHDVAVIDFMSGGTNLPQNEVQKASSEGPMAVLRSGETFSASLTDLTGSPLRGVFSNGRTVEVSSLGRIYVSSPQGISGLAASEPAPAAAPASQQQQAATPLVGGPGRRIVVPGDVAWTNTGIQVTQGLMLKFRASGETRLSSKSEDVASAAGAKSQRYAGSSPVSTAVAGALIGRIDNGQAFLIGDNQNLIPMPANGRLFLGINDDHVADNDGSLTVVISR